MSEARTQSSAEPQRPPGLMRRVAVVGVLLSVLVGLVLISRRLQTTTSPTEESLSILDEKIEDVEFPDTTQSKDILAVAREAIDKLLATYPKEPAAWSALARMHVLIGENQQAQEAWKKSLEVAPNFPEALYGLGMTAFEDDDYETAAGYYQDSALVSPADPRLPVAIADSLLRAGKVEQAILILEQHVAAEKTSVEAWLQLGQAHLQVTHFARAIECFETVLSNAPDNRDAVYGLMRALAASGRREESQALDQRFRRLAASEKEKNAAKANSFTDKAYAENVLSQVYWDCFRIQRDAGEWLAAEGSLRRAIQLSPKETEYLFELRQLYRKQNRLPAAIDVSQRIVKFLPDDAEQWITLGGLYADAGRVDQAIESFKQSLEKDPDSPRSQQIRLVLTELKNP